MCIAFQSSTSFSLLIDSYHYLISYQSSNEHKLTMNKQQQPQQQQQQETNSCKTEELILCDSFIEKLKSFIQWFYTYVWAIYFLLVVILVYLMRGPLKITQSFTTATMFFNTLTPKFYVALTGTSSLISGLILIFEWWYFKKYGTSFIEQVSINHLTPILNPSETNTEHDTSNIPVTGTNECKVWKNPMSLFRGSEYQRLLTTNGKEPLTFHDMNLSAQEHQTFFSCEADEGKQEYERK
ncbi:unnamed protein product [Didymodactylos carnosus]|uniref:Protein ST7 homolog n=1 Tax=Didymodactylos carnosus TaxID=1234261 RepID=A0A8S2HEL4_9BILA|nr:unnamed protein product [Didymodactylos carnosus]CAF3631865.1 unnamed protein product [Didymodactylos carnosus]